MMIKNILLVLTFLPIVAIAQKTVIVKDFKYPLPNNISYDEGVRIAIERAKEKALLDAGLGESIKSYKTLSKTQNNRDFNQFFSSDIFSNLSGAIEHFEIL